MGTSEGVVTASISKRSCLNGTLAALIDLILPGRLEDCAHPGQMMRWASTGESQERSKIA